MTNNTKPEGKEILREQFTKETYLNWINSQGEPDIDYVDWLESRLLSPSSTAPQGEETYTREEVEGLLNKFCNEVMVGQASGTIPRHSNGISQYIIDHFKQPLTKLSEGSDK